MKKLALWLVVILHFYVILVNLIAFFVLPFTSLIIGIPFWYSVLLVTPLESIIIYLGFNRAPCPLTSLENKLRKDLGMDEVKGFVGYYFIKQKWRK